MDGFCWWLIKVLAEALIGKLLEWFLDHIKQKASRSAGKHLRETD